MLAAQEVNLSLIPFVCPCPFLIICVCNKEPKPTMQLKMIYFY